jgi:periplasmic copper chaperone A
MMTFPRSLLVAALPLLLTACGSGAPEANTPATESATPAAARTFGVSNVTLRLSANPQSPSAAYFRVNGGADGATLTGVTSPDVARIELHESRMEGGMMTMAMLPSVPVAPNQSVDARPGGIHAMLFDITPAARAAGKVRLTFVFAGGRTVAAETTLASMPTDDSKSGSGHQEH